jgi:ABC-type amino acid transport substrate-binding protein
MSVRRLGALAIVLALATCAQAQTSLETIRARGVLRVGVKMDAPPFASVDAAGRRVGFEIELARLFTRVLFDDDAAVQFVPATTATRFGLLQAGAIDLLIATVTALPERRDLAELSEPYFMSGSLVLLPRASPAGRLADLGGRRIAVIRGSVQERDVTELQPTARLVPVASIAEGVRAVKNGEVAAWVYDDVVVLQLAERHPDLRATGLPLRPRPYVVAARKGDAGLIRWVNGWLARIRRDGSYAELWRRHFAPFESRLVGG